MKNIKLYSSLLALALVLSLSACGSNSNSTNDVGKQASEQEENKGAQALQDGQEENLDDFEKQTADDTIVLGVGTINGDFIQGFNNDANDVNVRKFMGIEGNNGYNCYVIDEYGQFQTNTAALEKEPELIKNEDGSMTTKYTIKKDLKWSDGEPITADDYLFGILLESDKDFNTLTGSLNVGGDSLKGFEAFKKGETDSFEGLEKIDDYTFSITVDASQLPYFEAQALSNAGPTPLHYIGQNLAVSKDGKKLVVKKGYQVTDKDKEDYKKSIDNQIALLKENFDKDNEGEDKESEDYKKAKEELDQKEKDLEARKSGDVDPTRLLIEEAMIKETSDYRFNPAVTCGPYKFNKFENNMVKLDLNENYKGNFKGQKASIPHIIVQLVNRNIGPDLLENGDIDIWEAETDGGKIAQLKKAQEAGKIGLSSYERNGYGNIIFLTDRGATKYKEVRQAIASLMDRNEFVQSFLGGYGVVTNGMYGQSQWMYKERGADLQEKLTNWVLNIDKANELLDKTPYKFEKDGKSPWDKAKALDEFNKNQEGFDYYRYDENGNKLVVNQYGAEQSPITSLISNQLPPNAKQAGMEYNVTAGSFSTLMDYLSFPKEDAQYTAFSMASDFATPFDPWFYYSSEGPFNRSKVNDPKADEVTASLRKTDPSDKEGYLDKWEEFQKWYNDYLPEIPLYSNVFHTGYSNRIKGFDVITPVWQACDQINAMTIEK
ncbi:ABC transporter substrate-binding protein [uncultured Anaerococcus sp.]|uniref:ABC transporter substrate-binding protein n=1 Tax=uncultured Anaerococcus sp. TaxID=293428 RepID=UPI0025CC3BDB|nr:ABC transporter substrate-binding protein [uncultured Anaerococcus sp.]